MKSFNCIITGCLLLLTSIGFAQEKIAAFPGAEGGGMYTSGGRGGIVYTVNSLDDTGIGDATTREGTLRWCLAQPGPRTVVFKVSGLIHLKSILKIPGNTTIAGQTAPGDGICLCDYSGQLGGSNIIVRYMRFRMGDVTATENDAFWGRNFADIIIDHCSMSWSTDECASFYDNSFFTLQWCILSESLRNSVHEKGKHGYGAIWGGRTASFHHNLLAHHDSRNPRMCGSRYSNRADLELVDFRNNVIYNWGANSGYAGEGGRYNFVNNYYKPGPGSSNKTRIFQPYPDDGKNSQAAGIWGTFYVNGNYIDGSEAVTNDNWLGIHPSTSTKSKEELKSNVLFKVPNVTTETAQKAYDYVLAGVGASFVRDSTDARIINEVTNGLAPVRGSNGTTQGGLIDSQFDVGGWEQYTYSEDQVPVDADHDGMADQWELEKGLNPNDGTDGNLVAENGFTLLETYLNTIVDSVSVIDSSDIIVPVDTVDIVDPIDTVVVVDPIDTVVVIDPIDTVVVVDPVDTTDVTSVHNKEYQAKLLVYPNPAVGTSCIRFNLEQEEAVKVEIITVTGKTVKLIANDRFNRGINIVSFEAKSFSAGLYFCRIATSSGNNQITKFMVR
jgi:hypothetical protein